jgi:nucleotide-binding universal stress UspA family protein
MLPAYSMTEVTMYQRILVAVDCSPTSLRGLDEAIKVAKSGGGRLMLVHVVNEAAHDRDVVPSVYYDSIVQSLRQSGIKVLEQTSTVVRRADVPCEPDAGRNAGRAAWPMR